ncbi:MAG TPA: caspase family protein, partial [Candidatus Acidoferrum sp.]|nr:caspase family protein [Candidatus Acidoferrum sp.]
QPVLRQWPGWAGKLWYAPEARQYVKAEGRFEIELSDFQVVSLEHPPATPPFQISLQQPKDQEHVNGESIVVTGRVTAPRGVSRVVITVNGKEVAKQEEQRTPKTEVGLSTPITLREGKNVLHVAVTDASGDTRQEARVLYYDRSPPSPGATPPAPPPPTQAAAPLLQVNLSYPTDQTHVDRETIAVAGSASGGAGIKQVVVALNGIEMGRLGGSTPQPSLGINLPVRLAEGINTLVLTATDASGAIRQEVRTIYYEPRVPLTITVRYPEDRVRLTEAQTVVAAQVSSSRGVSKVTVTLNGTEVYHQDERTTPKSVVITAPVTLRDGVNVIGINASDPDGSLKQEVRTVTFDRAPGGAIAARGPSSPPTRNRWAVVIGVGHYDRPGIPGLHYSVADAEAFHQILIDKANFKKENVLLLTDKTEKRPTLRNIKWALGTFLARSALKDDLVIIYYAGHGAPEVDPRGAEPDGLAKYLVPSDADPDDLYSTALPMDEVQTIFGRIEAEQVVVFLDACYSGAAGGRTFASRRTRASRVDDVFLDRITHSKGRVIITASRASEVSIELPELGHGIFTYY